MEKGSNGGKREDSHVSHIRLLSSSDTAEANLVAIEVT
jgi:hypothetical protein